MRGSEWVLVGPGDFKSLCRARHTVRGGFDSHTFPPGIERNPGIRCWLQGRAPRRRGRRAPGGARRRKRGQVSRATTAPASGRNSARVARGLAALALAALAAAGGRAAWAAAAAPPDSLAGRVAPLVAAADPQGPAPAAAPTDTLAPQIAQAAIPDFFDTGVDGTAAVLLTPLFPGWGQLYAENSWRAMLAFGTQWYFWANMLSRDRQAVRYREYARTLPEGGARDFVDDVAVEYWEQMRDYAWWSGAILLIVAVDAYVGAGLYGFDQEPLPVPSRFEEFFDRGNPEPVGSRGSPQLLIWRWSRRF